MDIRYSEVDQAAARLTGAEPRLSAVVGLLERLPGYPWRFAWIRVHAGLALFHFHRAGDPPGEFRRVPVGLLSLATLPESMTLTMTNAILKRAAAPTLRTVKLPVEALALRSPLGIATYEQVAG